MKNPKSRHNVLADDSVVISLVVPKLIKSRINMLGNFSGRIRKYIIDGLLKDERMIARMEKKRSALS